MKALLITALLTTATSVSAQEDYEYRMEIGAGLGLTSYQGDFNGSLTRNMQPATTLTARLKPNPRIAWAFNISYTTLKGDNKNSDTYYPDLNAQQQSFSNATIDGGARFEYNFWPYGTGNDYRGAKRLTPFIAAGIGLTYADTQEGGVVAANIPLGAGVKYKLAKRVNFTAEWTIHFTTSDKIDGISDPYGIKSNGMFKNKDSYSILQIGVTYDIWPKCRTCHNDDD